MVRDRPICSWLVSGRGQGWIRLGLDACQLFLPRALRPLLVDAADESHTDLERQCRWRDSSVIYCLESIHHEWHRPTIIQGVVYRPHKEASSSLALVDQTESRECCPEPDLSLLIRHNILMEILPRVPV